MPRAPEELESFIEHAILLTLGARKDVRLWKQKPYQARDARGKPIGGLAVPKGACDLSGIIKPEGWRLEVEVKSEDGSLREDQVKFAAMIKDCGGRYILARSVDEAVRQLESFLAAHRRS